MTERAIGARLAEARAAQGLSAEEVASRLLLSIGQVRGLERDDPTPFYSAGFYHQALTKYATLARLPPDELPTPPPPAAEAPIRAPLRGGRVQSDSDPDATASGAHPAHPLRRAAASTAVALAVLAAAIWWTGYRRPTPPPLSDEVGGTPIEPIQPERPQVERAPPTARPELAQLEPALDLTPDGPPPPGSAGTVATLRANTATWLFARFADGTTIERRLDAGAAHAFELSPTYLEVGSTDVTLTVTGRTVDTVRWARDGRLRIGARAWATLASAANGTGEAR
jgi:transcriptional regulator with XRE-family HTH domain